MNSSEKWQPVEGFEGLYWVSNEGRLKNRKGHILARRIRKKDGYNVAQLYRKGVGPKYLQVSRLVLAAFVGPCPDGHEAAHNNGNPNDDRLCNLRWATHKSNMLDRERHGTTVKGERHPAAKLTEEQVRSIRRSAKSHRQLASEFGVSSFSVGQIKRGNTWEHLL